MEASAVAASAVSAEVTDMAAHCRVRCTVLVTGRFTYKFLGQWAGSPPKGGPAWDVCRDDWLPYLGGRRWGY